eukprot:1228140-Pleurochrysis_carterae.AAC.1
MHKRPADIDPRTRRRKDARACNELTPSDKRARAHALTPTHTRPHVAYERKASLRLSRARARPSPHLARPIADHAVEALVLVLRSETRVHTALSTRAESSAHAQRAQHTPLAQHTRAQSERRCRNGTRTSMLK